MCECTIVEEERSIRRGFVREPVVLVAQRNMVCLGVNKKGEVNRSDVCLGECRSRLVIDWEKASSA